MTVDPIDPWSENEQTAAGTVAVETPPTPVLAADPLDDVVDSYDARMMLGVSEANLRQMVFRKQITPVGRKQRKNLFARADINALIEARTKK